MLEQFVMTLDQRKRRLQLLRIGAEEIPPEPQYELGLAFEPTDRGLLVREVFDDTPGSHADLQPDDLVIAVGGKRPDQRGCLVFGEMAEVDFTIERNGTTLDKTLVMRPVIP